MCNGIRFCQTVGDELDICRAATHAFMPCLSTVKRQVLESRSQLSTCRTPKARNVLEDYDLQQHGLEDNAENQNKHAGPLKSKSLIC